jgi:Holliday junction resolvase RusA-like endonuclease
MMPSFDFPEIPMADASTRKNEGYAHNVALSSTIQPHTFCGYEVGIKSLKIIVPGEPVPKGRPRARIVEPRSKPRFTSFYQDADTEAYEKRVAWQGKVAMQGRGVCLGALRAHVMVFVPIPRSWSNKQRQQAIDGVIFPTSRPDADNFLKCACDALNGICWKDDAQIVDMRVSKRYSETPSLEIEIFPV